MKLSESIQMIWGLAGQEGAAGQFPEIEPEHFCMALLKFAELPDEKLEQIDPEIGRVMANEKQLLHEGFQKCDIETTPARRKLRERFGKGNGKSEGDKVHRSAASRALFEAAAVLAKDSGGESITPLHLLTAIVQSPTPAIAEAVLGKPPKPAEARPISPLLLEAGEDIVVMAAQEGLKPSASSEAQCKAVVQALQQNERWSVLLVSDSEAEVREVVNALGCVISGADAPESLRGRRLLDVREGAKGGVRGKRQISPDDGVEYLERMRKVLAAAIASPEVILVVPAMEAEAEKNRAGQWARMLEEVLPKRATQFICRVSPQVFEAKLRKDTIWKRHTQAVWLQKTDQKSIPREL